MGSDPVVVFDSVWKKFRRGERHDSLRDLIPAAARRLLGRKKRDDLEQQEFWAVEDVSFEVRPGEALGIIGPNGAGKSTVLKLLTRILRPTRGTAKVRGRTGALIEVSAGFHPDLTGRENVYLQAAIMGMKRPEVERQFDEIVEFAGVSDFIDTPVKRYSSGMNARLGFSIAAHLDPAALVIDEVLSVGDMQFQQRCIERMLRFKRDGVAIVFVSHNLQAVSTLCDQALYLRGSVQGAGPTRDVLERYVAESGQSKQTRNSSFDVVEVRLTDVNGQAAPVVSPGTAMRLRVTLESRIDIGDLTFGFLAYRTTDNLLVYDGNVSADELGIAAVNKGGLLTLDYVFTANLTRGHYKLECHVHHNATQTFLLPHTAVAMFAVEESKTYAGVADLALSAHAWMGESVAHTG
jgi:lipopolysaccharide transport system ATP-binding protein